MWSQLTLNLWYLVSIWRLISSTFLENIYTDIVKTIYEITNILSTIYIYIRAYIILKLN